MGDGLYLGKQVDPRTGKLGERLELDPADLLTHGLVVGMTGSGKTGLAVVLVEELLRHGIPVIAIDPKGDLANLLLLFEKLDAGSFEPWIDGEAARRAGQDVKTAAASAAAAWRKGLAEWGLGEEDVAALKRSHDAVVFTPGSRAGVPLNVLQSLDAPAGDFDAAEEDLRDEIQSIVSGLLGLVRVEADPLQSPPAVFLANLVERSWRAGKGLTLEGLIGAIADPPFDRIGALPLETAFPRKERQGLMMALNNLLASPSFESWREGEPLDVERMLRAPDGRPRLSVVSTAHLSDEERLFVTALLLDKVKTWMRRQGGTTALRALVYMDEIFGYFPPHPANPPTKRPLLTLLKQARAQGVGVVLATQNPVDLDYKGLANMGTWMVGTLQTQQDRDRLAGGLQGAGLEPKAVEALLGATKKRVFLLHDVHRPGPCLLQSRWAMSYLRGPLTREEISRLIATSPAAEAAARPRAEAEASGPPVLPAPFRHLYLKKRGGPVGTAHLLVKYAVRYKGADEAIGVRAWPLGGATPADTLEAEPFDVDEASVVAEAPPGLRYLELPAWLASSGGEGRREGAPRPPRRQAHGHGPPRPRDEGRLAPGRVGRGVRGPDRRRRGRGRGGEAAPEAREEAGRTRRARAGAGRAQAGEVAGGRLGRPQEHRPPHREEAVGVRAWARCCRRTGWRAPPRRASRRLRAETAELERQLAEATEVDPARLVEESLAPVRGGVELIRYEIIWVY